MTVAQIKAQQDKRRAELAEYEQKGWSNTVAGHLQLLALLEIALQLAVMNQGNGAGE